MKFLVIGLGSMGKRRIRNLQYLKAGEIIGFDISEDRRKEVEEKYKIKTFSELEDAMKNVDAFIISTPPNRHIEFATIAAENNKHFFTEVNVMNDLSKMEKLIELIKGKSIVAAPSSTFRHNQLIKKMKDIVINGSLGRPLSFEYHCGQYLPDWHPWEDYRSFYVSRPETAACREISVFELSWIKWLLGSIESISCVKNKLSDIDAKIDDTYHFLIKTSNEVIGHMLIDVISCPAARQFVMVFENGTVVWDWTNHVLKVYKNNKWKVYCEKCTPAEKYIAGEEMYIEEMRSFINAIKNKESYAYSFQDELETIQQFFEAEDNNGNRAAFSKDIIIDDKKIGKNHPIFVIAEAGVNHNGSLDLAKKLVDAAKDANADAIKFQTFRAENVVTEKADVAKYQKTDKTKTQQEMLKKLELNYNDFKELKKYCDKKGIIFLSTPHSEDAIDFLDKLVPVYKVGSGDLTNLPVLEKIAKKCKPVILATGMSTLAEVNQSVSVMKEYNLQLVLMHCTTEYPCPIADVNLGAMQTMKRFGFQVGYSDHTQNNLTAILAVSMGATVIEKHFTLDKSMDGPDHRASIEPAELKELIMILKNPEMTKKAVAEADPKDIKKILGSYIKKPTVYEKGIARIVRKSIVAARNIAKGEQLSADMLVIKRPGTGIEPKYLDSVIGLSAKKDIQRDKLIKWSDLQ